MALKFCEGVVTHKRVWAPGLFTKRIKVDGVLPFEPGQFLQVGIENEGSTIYRPYSVASPHGKELEFYIVTVDDGELTPHLWASEVGDRILVSERAAGRFTLEKTPVAENLWLVATGTGLAPYVAMLRTPTPWNRYKRIVVVHGVRQFQDLSYGDEFDEFKKQHHEQFVYIPALTRETVESTLHGRIPQLLESGELEKCAGCQIKPDNTAIMLCGNPAMLDEMEEKLGVCGLEKHRSKSPGQIVLERYW